MLSEGIVSGPTIMDELWVGKYRDKNKDSHIKKWVKEGYLQKKKKPGG